MKKGCLFLIGLFILLLIISLTIALLQRGVPLGEKVALVRIEGPIIDSKNAVYEIKEHAKDPSVKAVVL